MIGFLDCIDFHLGQSMTSIMQEEIELQSGTIVYLLESYRKLSLLFYEVEIAHRDFLRKSPITSDQTKVFSDEGKEAIKTGPILMLQFGMVANHLQEVVYVYFICQFFLQPLSLLCGLGICRLPLFSLGLYFT